jgi:molybdopterin-guanine dinucleotide biosynthesis adapter protein
MGTDLKTPPVVAVVGPSNSGKTTLVEKLLSELSARGYRVASVKHAPQESSVDLPGSDTWRHLQAGSAATALYAPDKLVLMYPDPGELTTADLARRFGAGFDLLLAEGFKQDPAPKIEVHRKGHAAPLEGIGNRIAVATDEPLPFEVPQFGLEDVGGLVDLIRRVVIDPAREVSGGPA